MKKKIRNDKLRKWRARRSRVGTSIASTDRPRLTVYRSAKHIYAQLVDAETGRTIASASSRSKDVAGDLTSTGNVEAAAKVGALIAQRAKAAGVSAVAFDRSGYRYHGRVKALADAAREGGLEF